MIRKVINADFNSNELRVQGRPVLQDFSETLRLPDAIDFEPNMDDDVSADDSSVRVRTLKPIEDYRSHVSFKN